MPPFTGFKFPVTGGPSPGRNMPDRLADVINVKDWGALGDATANDGPAIQAAIDYCLGTTTPVTASNPSGTKVAGGIVFFPSGNYMIGAPLECGSNISATPGINLLGCGGHSGNTFITHHGSWSNPNSYADISKGGKIYDSIDSIIGFTANVIKLTRNGALAEHCASFVDMSECVGGGMYCNHVDFGGRPSAIDSPHFRAIDPCFILGKACTAVSCRAQSLGMGFALGGDGASTVGCSCETDVIGFRIGWTAQHVKKTSASTAAGSNVLTFSPALSDGVAVIGRVVSHGNLPGGTTIIAVDRSAGTLTLSANVSGGGIGSNSDITFAQEVPVRGCTVQGAQCERNDIACEIYNGRGCLIIGNTFYQQEGCPLIYWMNLTWSAGIVTATGIVFNNGTGNWDVSGAPLNIPAGSNTILQFYSYQGNGAAYIPPQALAVRLIGPVTSTGPSATTFTYPLAANPGAGVARGGMTWPATAGIRVRRAIDCYIGANQLEHGVVNGDIDLDYDGTAYHRNNVLAAINCSYGIKLPTNSKNLAGWKFIQTAASPGLVPNTFGTVTGYPTLAQMPGNPNARMKFSDLPDNGASVPQDGPIEGQEFSILDGTNGVAIGSQVTGGGQSGHYLVRYSSTNQWVRIG